MSFINIKNDNNSNDPNDIGDFENVINASSWLDIIQGKEHKLPGIINDTIDEVKGYIAGRYDPIRTFEKEGDEREGTLKNIILNIVVYEAIKTLNSRFMTQTWVDANADAERKLEKIQKGMIVLLKAEPHKDETGQTVSKSVRLGGNLRKRHRFN